MPDNVAGYAGAGAAVAADHKAVVVREALLAGLAIRGAAALEMAVGEAGFEAAVVVAANCGMFSRGGTVGDGGQFLGLTLRRRQNRQTLEYRHTPDVRRNWDSRYDSRFC